MRMDYDVIRQILLNIESFPSDKKMTEETLASGDLTPEVVAFHLDLLADAGYIERLSTRTMSSKYNNQIVLRMTFKGHEYLDTVREPKIWRETKSRLKTVGSATLEVIKSIATDIIISSLNQPGG